jgi:hypothetical protein
VFGFEAGLPKNYFLTFSSLKSPHASELLLVSVWNKIHSGKKIEKKYFEKN